MSHFVSADGRWQWNGHRWKRVEPEWGPDQVEYINESYQGLHETPGPDPEEIELDEIELNTADDIWSEAAPLLPDSIGLAEAGGTLGTAAAATPGVGTVLAGTVGTALIVGGGTAVATALSNREKDHTDPVVSLPGHHYIGPGNSIDSVEPVDTDDIIAEAHDKVYEVAKTQEDIHNADHNSANDFLTDVIESGNPHSVAGYIGLKTKETIEGLTGVQYPPNLPSVSGMSRVPRAAGKYRIDRDPSKHPEFPTDKNQQRYAWDAWNRARQNHGLPRVDPPNHLGIARTPRPPVRNDGSRPSSDSITYREWKNRVRAQSGPLIDGFNRQREQQANRNDHLFNTVVWDELSSQEQRELNDIVNQLEQANQIPPPVTDRDSVGTTPAPIAGPSGMNTRGNKRGNDGPQGGNPAPPQPAAATPTATAAATGAGHNSSSDGGFDSAQGPVSFLPKGGYKSAPGMMSFTKVHKMKSWAVPYTNVASTDRSGANMVVTPLAKIPWEYAFFYMSPEDFALIPAGSYIHSCSIKVIQGTCSTGYPTGGSTSTIATTNHSKILVIGKDLEAKSSGGLDKIIELDSKMIPKFKANVTQESQYDTFIAQQYGTDQTAADTAVVLPGAAFRIPFYNYQHFCVYQPNRAQALARNFFKEDSETPPNITENNAPGFEYFVNMITELNANDVTWDDVDEMHYKFESAPIGEQFPQLEILATNFTQSTGNAAYYNAKRSVTNTGPKQNTTFTESYVPSTRNSLPVVTYKSAPMEKGSYFVKGDAAHKPARQPSYHIGVRAIEKPDPALGLNRAADFVQAVIEFDIVATINITLPQYPNRFLRPKFYNTSMENAVMGIGSYPAYNLAEKFVRFNLYNESAIAPAKTAVDAQVGEATEDDETIPAGRPRRALPRVPVTEKPKRKRR